MNVADIRAVLKECEYKPGWQLSLVEGHPEGLVLNIRAEVHDAYHPQRRTVLSIDSYLPPLDTKEDLLRWIGWRLQRCEIHEAMEWWRYRGVPVCNPHAA